MNTRNLETTVHGLEAIAFIVRADFNEPGVSFFTPPSFPQQIGLLQHPKGKKIAPHIHKMVLRQVVCTQEVLLIRRGTVRVNLYSSNKEFIDSVVLQSGDVIFLCGGGHSLEMLEDATILEVKQGPYSGVDDKIHFEEDVHASDPS